MKQRRQAKGLRRQGLDAGQDVLDQHRMLGHGERPIAVGLAVPAGDPGEAVGDILDFDIEGRGVEQVETPAA